MISLASLNCNGLRKKEKRTELFAYFAKIGFDIILLQGTFFDTSLHMDVCREWQGTVISSTYTENNRRGVTCLIKKNSDIDIVSHQTFNNGRLLEINILVDEHTLSIFNIYAPCECVERKRFFLDLKERVSHTQNQDHIIIFGDFNNVLNSYLDKYPPVPHPDSSRKALKNIMDSANLSDIWRVRNDDKIAFTRIRNASNGRVASRIDRFLISKILSTNITKCGITNYPRSDHEIIFIHIDFNIFPRGPGSWIFNNTLLDDKLFCDEIRELIILAKSECVFDNGFLIWYDDLKAKIKQKSITFSKKRRRRLQKDKKNS